VWLRAVVDGVEGDGIGGYGVSGVDGASCGDRGWLGLESPTVLVRGLSDSAKNWVFDGIWSVYLNSTIS
jgi:hypothetical protein